MSYGIVHVEKLSQDFVLAVAQHVSEQRCLSFGVVSYLELASYLIAPHDLVQQEGRLSFLKTELFPLASNSVNRYYY